LLGLLLYFEDLQQGADKEILSADGGLARLGRIGPPLADWQKKDFEMVSGTDWHFWSLAGGQTEFRL